MPIMGGKAKWEAEERGGGGEAAETQAEEGGERGRAGADGSRAEAEREGGRGEGGEVKWKLPSASLSIIGCEHLPLHPQMLACHCPLSNRVVMTPSHTYT